MWTVKHIVTVKLKMTMFWHLVHAPKCTLDLLNIVTPRHLHIIRSEISVLPQTWRSPAVFGWKLVLFQQMFCSREPTNYYVMIQQDEKSTQVYIGPIRGGSSVPTEGLGKTSDKDSNYRNHQIFTLRCISKGIPPVSFRLKNYSYARMPGTNR